MAKSAVTRKTEIAPVNGTPEKRMFWSIVSDYDLKTALCELVDNALDLWTTNGRRRSLKVKVELDASRQIISVTDNAGGVRQEDLRLLVAPGGSRNDPGAELVGVFGVGSKRAGIALGEWVQVSTRFRREQSHQIEITREWLGSEDWELPVYAIPDIDPNTTRVVISQLRRPLQSDDIVYIEDHFSETYSWFIAEGCEIEINGSRVSARTFEKWAYPKGQAPRHLAYNADFRDEGKVHVEITGGLIQDRDPEEDNYGVYVYCNHRLIVKELRTREVGYFVTSEAGVPHPDASLCRVIVRLQGPAQLMPWNSSKNGINYSHPVFENMRRPLIQLVSHFSSLSRRLKSDWDGAVFRHKAGTVEEVESSDKSPNSRILLPALPRVRRAHVEHLTARNKGQIDAQPWTLGLVEAMGAVEVLRRQRFETKNRIALLLLDSNFEIALKEFIVHRDDLFPASTYNAAKIQAIFSRRHLVIDEVKNKIRIPASLLDKARHYYGLRNKLIHERATVDVADSDVHNYEEVIQRILKILFDLRFD